MNRAHEIERVARSVLDILDEVRQFSPTATLREEARRLADEMRGVLALPPISPASEIVPTWREFARWNDTTSDRTTIVRVDVRHVVAVDERERRHAYGGWQRVAFIRLHDGAEYCVEDPQRRVWLMCKERDHEPV